jgi:hypothetical protein
MKKLVTIFILAIVAAFTFASCELSDDNSPTYNFEFAVIDSVDVPENFVIGETKEITVYYNRPSTCHFDNGFYYEKNLNTRTFALQMAVLTNSTCEPLEEEVSESSFNFYVENNGTYIFKFYNGKDAQGQNTFLEYEIPVIQP